MHLKYRYLILSTGALIVMLFGLPSYFPAAQLQAQPKRVLIYVKQQGDLPNHKDITDFVTKLLQLGLAELKGISVERTKTESVCTVERDSIGQGPAQGSKTKAQPGDDRDFYFIQVDIKVQKLEGREDEIILDYKLSRYIDCQPIVLAHSADPFSEPVVLKYLNSMADVVSLAMEEELQPKKGSVSLLVTSGDRVPQEIKIRATDYFKQKLIQLGGFELRVPDQNGAMPQADYAISGTLSVRSNKVQAKFSISSTGVTPLNTPAITGPAISTEVNDDDWSDFYILSANSAIKGLNGLHEAKLAKNLNTANIPLLLRRTKELMCVKEGNWSNQDLICNKEVYNKDCQFQPEAAIPLLMQFITSNEPSLSAKLPWLRLLLAKAYIAAEDTLSAAEELEKVRQAPGAIGAECKVDLINQAADAWYNAKNYEKAQLAYEESLKLSNHQPLIYLQRAKSFRFGGNRLKAFEILLEGLDLPQQSNDKDKARDYLKKEMEDVVLVLRDIEIDGAEKILAGWQTTPATVIAKPLIERRNTLGLLRDAGAYYSQKDFKRMDELLMKAEAISDSAFTPSLTAERFRLRALWHRDNKAQPDFKKAEDSFKKSIAINNTQEARLDLALTYLRHGQQGTSPEAKEDGYEKALPYLSDLTQEGFQAAYSPLRWVNALVGKDDDSKDLFEGILKKNPADVSAEIYLHHTYKRLGKFENALKLAKKLEAGEINVNNNFMRLHIAETYILAEQYTEAKQRLSKLNPNSGFTALHRSVLMFYQVWTGLAQDMVEDARRAYDKLEEAHKLWGSGDETAEWDFQGAMHFLNRARESGKMTEANRAFLKAIVDALSNKHISLPSFSSAQS